MKVERFGPAGTSAPRRGERAPTAKAGAFAARLLDETEAPLMTSAASAVAPVDSLLAIQEVEGDESKKRRAVSRGHGLLDELEGLRNAILLGEITPGMLGRLQVLFDGERPEMADPALAELLNEIEIRVAVELAKIELRRN